MILIAGATGILGGMITQRLLREGKEVRILVRRNSPSEQMALQGMATSARSLIEAGAKPIYGDLKDRASLIEACDGIEVVITTANSAMRGGEDTVDTVDRQGNRNLIEAAQGSGGEAVHLHLFPGCKPKSSRTPLQGKGRDGSCTA